MARVEEARRRALGRLAALEPGARRGHREAALLGRLADRLEVLGAAGPVDGGRGALIGAERLLVVGLGLLGGAGHLDVEVERADLLAELDDVGAHGVAHLLELGRLLAAPAARRGAAGRRRPARARRARSACPRRGRRRRRVAAASLPARTSPMRSTKSSRIARRPSPRLALSAASAALAVAPSGTSPVLPARNVRPDHEHVGPRRPTALPSSVSACVDRAARLRGRALPAAPRCTSARRRAR